MQGLSAAGEYAGAVTYVIQHAPSDKRSRSSSWMRAATFGSFAAAALLSYALTAGLPPGAMEAWGWRIPFLATVPLGLVAFYIFATYMTTFLREVVHLPPEMVLLSNVLALSFAAVLAPFTGLLCDRLGRRPTMVLSSVLLGVLAIPAYMIAGSGGMGLALLSQIMLALGAVTANVVNGSAALGGLPDHGALHGVGDQLQRQLRRSRRYRTVRGNLPDRSDR